MSIRERRRRVARTVTNGTGACRSAATALIVSLTVSLSVCEPRGRVVLGVATSPPAGGDVRFVEYVDLDATDALRAFRDRYHERFNREPAGPHVLTYDAVRLVIAGVRACARTGRDLHGYLVSLGRTAPPYDGLTGPIAFDDDSNVNRSYVFITLRPGRAP